MVRSKKKDDKQLTDVELEMMNIIWRIGPCTVHQILDHLPKERDLAYTTVSTMVRILEQKKFVGSKKDGRGHLYHAEISKDAYEASSVAHLVKSVFQGEPRQLVQRLISSEGLTPSDLEELKEFLQQRVGK